MITGCNPAVRPKYYVHRKTGEDNEQSRFSNKAPVKTGSWTVKLILVITDHAVLCANLLFTRLNSSYTGLPLRSVNPKKVSLV